MSRRCRSSAASVLLVLLPHWVAHAQSVEPTTFCAGKTGVYGDVGSGCVGYFICTLLGAYYHTCKDGTLFNDDYSSCDWSRRVRADTCTSSFQPMEPAPTEPTTPTEPTPSPTQPTPSPRPRPVCECTYNKTGCRISKAAPAGLACNCLRIGSICRGIVQKCKMPSSEWCARPDTSVQSCVQGTGNCKGYSDYMCDCAWQRKQKLGGCKISKLPPSGMACKCKVTGIRGKCNGSLVECSDKRDSHCLKPDLSKETCRLGRGNCNGY